MASKVTTIGDLIHRVATSCLSNRLPRHYTLHDGDDDDLFTDFADAEAATAECDSPPAAREVGEEEEKLKIWEEEKMPPPAAAVAAGSLERARDAEALMVEVFDAVSGVRRAYAALQGAHCPWDPEKMRAADAAVVAELRRLARLRDRFRRAAPHHLPRPKLTPPLREAVAPYEAALDDLQRQLRDKQAEVDSLKEKLQLLDLPTSGSRNGLHPKRIAGGAPTPELFAACVGQARAATRAFAAHLLHLIRAARLDAAAAVRALGGTAAAGVPPQHAKYELEAHATRALLHGFEHESFYLDGSLSSLLDPAAFRRERYAQFRDMRGMDPAELLGVLPTCAFGRYAARKYAALLPARVEEAVLGNAEHRRQVEAGTHPRTAFYGEFLRAAKAVWMLHLLAFALEPPPSHFEAGRGAEFQPEYMESVAAPRGGTGMVVGFAVAPGFRLGNGAVVRARVYLVPRR